MIHKHFCFDRKEKKRKEKKTIFPPQLSDNFPCGFHNIYHYLLTIICVSHIISHIQMQRKSRDIFYRVGKTRHQNTRTYGKCSCNKSQGNN